MKQPTSHSILALLFVVALAGAAAYGIYRTLIFVISGVLSLDAGVSAAIIAASTTVLVSVVTIIYSQRKTKEREIAESHRPKKIELYKHFMDEALVGLLRASKGKEGKSLEDKDVQDHLEDFFFKFTADAIVWGSPQVIKAYKSFRQSGNQPQILLRVDDMLRAIRKDLGHSNHGIKKGDLMGLFLTDPEKLQELVNLERRD